MVFRLDQAGKETIFHSFSGGNDGCQPHASLVRDTEGYLYGTAGGTVFKLDKAGKERVLLIGSGGDAGLVRDQRGNLYGTGGGAHSAGDGTVFKLSTSGKATVLHTFTGSLNHGPDGASPLAGVVRDPEGNLYGTTVWGGTYGHGTVFRVDPNGKETVLHSFGATGDGAQPFADLVLDSRGNLYGTTFYGGLSNYGTVFKVDETGKETILYSFVGNGDGRLSLGWSHARRKGQPLWDNDLRLPSK